MLSASHMQSAHRWSLAAARAWEQQQLSSLVHVALWRLRQDHKPGRLYLNAQVLTAEPRLLLSTSTQLQADAEEVRWI